VGRSLSLTMARLFAANIRVMAFYCLITLARAIMQRLGFEDLHFPREYLTKPASCKVWATTVTLDRLTPSISARYSFVTFRVSVPAMSLARSIQRQRRA
jgi:hypothetical protein